LAARLPVADALGVAPHRLQETLDLRETYPEINEVGSFSPPQLRFALSESPEIRRFTIAASLLLTTC
jgi:hypothetical protein